jgi:hypothetical protein
VSSLSEAHKSRIWVPKDEYNKDGMRTSVTTMDTKILIDAPRLTLRIDVMGKNSSPRKVESKVTPDTSTV